MAFDIKRARGSLPGRATEVRANLDVRTGGQQIARAVAGFGGVMAALGERWDLQEADTQFTQAKADARNEHNRFLLSLQGMEPDEYEKAYESSIEKRQGFAPKNKRGAREYDKWLTTLDPYWIDDKNEAMKAKLNDNGRAVGFGLQRKAIETGEMDEYFVHLAKGTKLGYYSKEQSAKYRQSTIENRERYVRLQAVQKEEQLEIQREKDRDEISKLIRTGELASSVIESSILDEKEQWTWFERERAETERRLKGQEIVLDEARKHELLDMAAAIKWPDRNVNAQEVKDLAYEDRFGPNPILDEVAYDEVRDAIRRAEEDIIPFTQKFIETTIGELITGAPKDVLGYPLPALRTREDAIMHATNAFGRFVNRIPGVMDTIDSIPRYAPKKGGRAGDEKSQGSPAYDFDGELIGGYNPDGSITLNAEGVRRLYEIAGRDAKKAREMALQNRYIIPSIEEK